MRNDPNAVWESSEVPDSSLQQQFSDEELWELFTGKKEVPYALQKEDRWDYSLKPEKASEVPWAKSIVLNSPKHEVRTSADLEPWCDYFLCLLWLYFYCVI